MLNIVGQIASKGDFYPRRKEVERIERHLQAGVNMQLAAPRRVGKSSILYYLKDNPAKGFMFEYIDVESARTSDEFYRKIYKAVLRGDALSSSRRIWEQIKNGTSHYLGRLKNIKIGGAGSVDLNEDIAVNYEEELLNLLLGMDLEGDRLVIMVDEFPEVILNIVEDNKGDTAEAIAFLQSNRALRSHDGLRGKVQFIYTGSNSLNVTVAGLDSPRLINDLAAVPVEPLSQEQSADLVYKVLNSYGYSIGVGEMDYLIRTVEWCIPFYFQLVIQEIISLVGPNAPVSQELIDAAIGKVAGHRNDHHFEHYVKRLKRLFGENERQFISLFLNALAQSEKLSRNEAVNLAHGLIDEDSARRILSSLDFDGYIIRSGTGNHSYKFNSPILKNWWYNHEC